MEQALEQAIQNMLDSQSEGASLYMTDATNAVTEPASYADALRIAAEERAGTWQGSGAQLLSGLSIHILEI